MVSDPLIRHHFVIFQTFTSLLDGPLHSDAFRELYLNLAERDLMSMIIPEFIQRQRSSSSNRPGAISPTSASSMENSRPTSRIGLGEPKLGGPCSSDIWTTPKIGMADSLPLAAWPQVALPMPRVVRNPRSARQLHSEGGSQWVMRSDRTKGVAWHQPRTLSRSVFTSPCGAHLASVSPVFDAWRPTICRPRRSRQRAGHLPALILGDELAASPVAAARISESRPGHDGVRVFPEWG
jgi:hypothetical protein